MKFICFFKPLTQKKIKEILRNSVVGTTEKMPLPGRESTAEALKNKKIHIKHQQQQQKNISELLEDV